MNDILAEEYMRKTNNLIDKNPSCYIKEFNNFISSLSWKTKYEYSKYIIELLKKSGKTPETLSFDDYTGYLSYCECISNSKHKAAYTALKRYSSYLYLTEKNPKDYMSRIDAPRNIESQETIEKREIGFLTKGEIKKVLIKARDKQYEKKDEKNKIRDYLIVLLLLNTGMRHAAIWRLNVDDIDFENNKLIVVEKRRKVREYLLSQDVVDTINEWLNVRDTICDKSEKALFISRKTKGRLSYWEIGQIVNNLTKCISNKRITPHKLRATYGTQIYEATKDIYLTQECMGHSNPQTTERYIRGRKNDNAEKAKNIMEALTRYDNKQKINNGEN